MAEAGARPKRVTLVDVAKVAGVSVQTASHVMAGNMTVRLPESTRSRVVAAAQQVGYRPNRYAQAIRSGKTNVVSVWMPLDRPNTSYLRMLHLISEHAKTTPYQLMIVGLDRESALGATAKAPQTWPVDGVISIDAGKAIEAFRKDSYNDTTPVCVLGYEEVANGDTVAWDVLGAERRAIQELIAKGCRKIVHVTLDWILQDFPRERRRTGYTEAMTEAGLEPVFFGCQSESSGAIANEFSQFLDVHGVPDAITGMTDTLAIGAARALLTRGVRIPEDCRVFGFGDYPESEDFMIPISTISPPLPRIMETAWSWLTERMQDPNLEHRFVEIPMQIVERLSSQ